MPRNGSGTYTLPSGNPVVSGTLIDSTWANNTLSDLANEITNSLSRNGSGGMLAPLRFADGSLGAPGFAWTNETSSGFYRASAGEMWGVVLGTQVLQYTTTGTLVPSGKTFTLNGTFAGTGYVPVANGGTGATDAATARTNLGAQATLVSGTNIKTVGGTSLLGSGDISVGTGDVTLTGAQTLTNKTLVAPVNLASTTTTQDGVIITGRAGGTSSYRITLAPTTLTASRAITLPDAAGTVPLLENQQAWTKPQRPSLATETAPTTNALTWTLTSDTVMRVNLNANITTLTLSGTLSTLAGYQFQLVVRYNGGTSITWPASVKWPSGSAPTLTGTSGKIDVFNFVVASNDGGTTFFLFSTGYSQNL